MMPATYSAIAENKLTSVTGGNIGDAFPAVMNSANWRTFGTNVIKIIGNTFLANFVSTILGTAFGTNYAFGSILDAMNSKVAGMNSINTVMQVIGGIATIYSLGTDSAAILQNKKVVKVDGTVL